MTDEKKLDEQIARLVRSVELELPPAMQAKIQKAAANLRPRVGLFGMPRPFWLTLVPGAAALLLVVLVLVPALRRPPASSISEIRTEFEIADKNIKIIFIQKPDFNLFKEN